MKDFVNEIFGNHVQENKISYLKEVITICMYTKTRDFQAICINENNYSNLEQECLVTFGAGRTSSLDNNSRGVAAAGAR